MSESLLDAAIMVSRNALLDMGDSKERRSFAARLSLLERAAWTMELDADAGDRVVKLAKVILELRDEIVSARCDDLGLPTVFAPREPARNYLAG